MKAFSRARCRAGMLVGIIVIMASLVLFPAYVLARSRDVSQARSSQGSVTILVLDMSGSMAQNDPAGLRCSAANAFIDLSGPGSFR